MPWWGVAILALVVGAATCGLWAFVLSSRAGETGTGLLGGGLTPTFLVITNTATPDQPGELVATQAPIIVTATLRPTEPSEAPLPSQIVLGDQITISGTDGAGVAIRQGPGVSYAFFPEFVGRDGEPFLVEDGPRQNDGYTWWLISDPNNPDRFGWAVEDFMFKELNLGPLVEATPLP